MVGISSCVGALVGALVGAFVGACVVVVVLVGALVGAFVGAFVGALVGTFVGALVTTCVDVVVEPVEVVLESSVSADVLVDSEADPSGADVGSGMLPVCSVLQAVRAKHTARQATPIHHFWIFFLFLILRIPLLILYCPAEPTKEDRSPRFPIRLLRNGHLYRI